MAELRRELEELELDTTGSKSTLVARLREYYLSQGVDPETVDFADGSFKASFNALNDKLASLSSEITNLSGDMDGKLTN